MKNSRFTYLRVALSVLLFVYGFYMGGLQFVIADISASFGMQAMGIGILVSVPHIISLFLPILIGAISDRFGKKKMLLLFAGIFATGSAIACFSGSMAVYLLGSTLVGGAHSVCESVATAVIADTDPRNAARNINISQGLLSAGAVLGPIIVHGLVRFAQMNWRHLFAISGCGFALMIIVISFVKFPVSQIVPKGEKKHRKNQLLRSRVLLCALLSMTLYVSLEKGIGNFSESLFSFELGREDLGAYAISLFWIGVTLAHFVLSPKMERLRRMLMIHFMCSAALFVAYFLSANAYVSLAICFGLGFVFGPVWPSLVAMGTQEVPEHSGAVAGMMSAFGSAGSMIAPILVGAVSDEFGLRYGFLLLAAFSMIALCLLLIAKKRK